MALFGKGKEGGTLSVIRSPEEDYLIHKWRPSGDANSTARENSIRWGSSLRVRDGEVAVFVYQQKDGNNQDFVEGPFDEILKTANLPILSNIVGLAYGGDTPFQAQVYYINQAGTQQLRFAVPWFDIFDPRPEFADFPVPCSVHGTIYFGIDDYRKFIKLHRLTDFDLAQLLDKMRSRMQQTIKGIVQQAPQSNGLQVMQVERAIDVLGQQIMDGLRQPLEGLFGLAVRDIALSDVKLNKESEGFQSIKRLTADLVAAQRLQMNELQMKQNEAMLGLNLENVAESSRIQRAQLEAAQAAQTAEWQRRQRLETEQTFIGAHAVNRQADVLASAANNLGQMSNIGGASGSGGGLNPAGLMMGIGVGGAMAGQVAGMMAGIGTPGMMGSTGGPPPVPGGPVPPPPTGGGMPPVPSASFFLSIAGQQHGPYPITQLAGYAADGRFAADTMVWREGMAAWSPAISVPELAPIFAPPAPPSGAFPPPPPPGASAPPAPPSPPPAP